MAKVKAEDTQFILKIYDLRREPVMRAARNYAIGELWPQNYEEFKAIIVGYGTEPNAYLRQVLTFWNMIAAMVLRGAVDEQLFIETQTEPYFLWAKFGHYIPQARKDQIDPEYLLHLEKLTSKPAAKKKIKGLRDRLIERRATATAAAKAGK
ncbi:MAG: hypothetical protein LAO78_00515 [Acidobacteriia bacterium]|nr:hypothetical protein [Terriglobia bacterium]